MYMYDTMFRIYCFQTYSSEENHRKLSKIHCLHVLSYCQENISTIYFFICWTFRFMSASVEHNIQTYILELVHDQLTRRQTLDSITRNLLKLLTVTCGYSQIRLLVSQRLEMWLQNPKVCICLFVCFFTLMLYAKWWFNWTYYIYQ